MLLDFYIRINFYVSEAHQLRDDLNETSLYFSLSDPTVGIKYDRKVYYNSFDI